MDGSWQVPGTAAQLFVVSVHPDTVMRYAALAGTDFPTYPTARHPRRLTMLAVYAGVRPSRGANKVRASASLAAARTK